jgi:hypothetical protein
MTVPLYTASWTALWRASKTGDLAVQPVRISIGSPRFWRGAGSFPAIRELMPIGCFHLDGPEFEAAYGALLDKHGPDVIRDRLDALTTASALCCFEPYPKPCHRHLASRWIGAHLGIEIVELSEPAVQLRFEVER